MWTVLWPLLAAADSDQTFARLTDPPTARVYADVTGDGPVFGKWRRRSGPITAWAFSDGVLEHYERRDGKTLVERRHYDAVGRLLATVLYGEAGPTEVRVAAPGEAIVPLDGWTTHTVGGYALLLPAGATAGEGTLDWTDGTRRVRVATASEGDPLSDGYAAGLTAACGCVVDGRASAWLDGRLGSQYLLRFVDPDGDRAGVVWAFARDGGVLVLTVTAPADVTEGTGALGFGRALLALGVVAK